MNCQTKPKYFKNIVFENSWNIEYSNGKIYIVDEHIFEKILNFNKKFIFNNNTDLYPSYGVNRKYITLIEYIFEFNPELYSYTFKTNNVFDLRYKNIKNIVPKDFIELTKNYNVVEYLTDGVLVRRGKYAGELKNPICKILNKYNKEEYLMLCNKNKLCKLCPISYQNILDFEKNNTDNNNKIIWSYHTNGYILGNNSLYIHQVIMNYYWNGKGTKNKSVDHIDQDPLNNTYDNLRIVSEEVQRQNSKGIKEGTKRARKTSAQPLPEEINEDMIKKYVTYNKECYNKEKNLYREFFRVEKHPKLDKELSSSKSEKVSILEKLAQANKIVDDLENDIYPIVEEKVLPTFVSNREYRGKPHLTFDRKSPDGIRQNLRMVLPQEYELEEQLAIFREKIKLKYDFDV